MSKPGMSSESLIDLNRECQCVTLDQGALAREVRSVLGDDAASLASFFAPYGVFLTNEQAQVLRHSVGVLHRVLALPGFAESVARQAAWPQRATRGVFMGFDFHLQGEHPALIEINTNAGGALLNTLLRRHQLACCDLMGPLSVDNAWTQSRLAAFQQSFAREWMLAGRTGEPQVVAIVDDAPKQQFLYTEFRLFADLFEKAGWRALIVDAKDLHFQAGRLSVDGVAVDMVYNRLTDFALTDPAHGSLREAWLADAVVMTPDPWHHALYADKRNLVRLADQGFLEAIGAEAADRELLARLILPAAVVDAASAEALWHERRQYFFKPFRGYGSKAAYRGDKLTRGVWQEIVSSGQYIAQRLFPPGERPVLIDGKPGSLKFDLRCYVYDGDIQLMAARLYRGQTTNMRTPGGGFAPVFVAAPVVTPSEASLNG
jgi:hypothetical protein